MQHTVELPCPLSAPPPLISLTLTPSLPPLTLGIPRSRCSTPALPPTSSLACTLYWRHVPLPPRVNLRVSVPCVSHFIPLACNLYFHPIYTATLVSTCDARPKRAQHIYLVFHHILACSRLWSDPAFYMHPPQCSCVLHHHTFSLPPSTFTCASPSNPIKPAHEGSPPTQHAVEAFCPTTYLISLAPSTGPTVCATPSMSLTLTPSLPPPHIGDST